MARQPVEVSDTIDEKIAVWLREIPDLDARTEGVVDRIGMIQNYLRRTHDETLEQFGLTWGEVKVLSSLRYGGPPYQSTPGKLGSQLGLSSGAMTARLDKMEEAELIRRLPDPDDRRGVVIELMPRGPGALGADDRRAGREGVDRGGGADRAGAGSAQRPPAAPRARVRRGIRAALEAPRTDLDPAISTIAAMSSLEQVSQPSVARQPRPLPRHLRPDDGPRRPHVRRRRPRRLPRSRHLARLGHRRLHRRDRLHHRPQRRDPAVGAARDRAPLRPRCLPRRRRGADARLLRRGAAPGALAGGRARPRSSSAASGPTATPPATTSRRSRASRSSPCSG